MNTYQCLLSLAALGLPALVSANNCEALRAEIEAKIRAGGVTEFSVTVVPADAPASAVRGQVVGRCALGANQIVYTRAGAPPLAAAPARKPSARPVITECKDGSVAINGTCKK